MIYTNKHDQHVKRKPHQNHGGRREWKAKVTLWVSDSLKAHLRKQVRGPTLRTWRTWRWKEWPRRHLDQNKAQSEGATASSEIPHRVVHSHNREGFIRPARRDTGRETGREGREEHLRCLEWWKPWEKVRRAATPWLACTKGHKFGLLMFSPNEI